MWKLTSRYVDSGAVAEAPVSYRCLSSVSSDTFLLVISEKITDLDLVPVQGYIVTFRRFFILVCGKESVCQ